MKLIDSRGYPSDRGGDFRLYELVAGQLRKNMNGVTLHHKFKSLNLVSEYVIKRLKGRNARYFTGDYIVVEYTQKYKSEFCCNINIIEER